MLSIYDATTAANTILRRARFDLEEAPPPLWERIEAAFGERLSPEAAVDRILHDVRARGDAAVRFWTERLDGVALESLLVSGNALGSAVNLVAEEELEILKLAAGRIEAFHRRQPLASWITQEMGGVMGQLIRPIRRVGLYVPAGSAPLFSSVLMSAIPARVAGVPEIVVATPPQRQTGEVHPRILAAAAISGVSEVYAMGGAQAIGALAYGTESIPPVDKIFGPGNLFVLLAKKQVFGVVGIDGLAGPTETVIIADDSADCAWVASDLVAQAEHDPMASAILLTPSNALADAVQAEVARQIETLPRADIVRQALASRGGIVLTESLEQAFALSNAYAPEHLSLMVRDPWAWVEKVSAAGGVFLGEHSAEVLGDYMAGPSHVMPTGGSARFASPLNVWDFVHIISLVGLPQPVGCELARPAALLARMEHLEAHARSADRRAVLHHSRVAKT